MSHLHRIRKGWQNEHLAKFILSKFSFVAEPSNISDDRGSDFFCTIFKIIDEDSLIPQNSFAIQIKSSNKKFEITNKMDYLNGLEIPFFVGVVNRNDLKITIYSGECLSNFFANHGNPSATKKIYVKLVDERGGYPFYEEINDKFILKFPKVLELESNFDYSRDFEKLKDLFEVCIFTQQNISSGKNDEYIYPRFKGEWVDIFAGPSSFNKFRENFMKRLAEVFYNLEGIYTNVKEQDKIKIKQEFEIYEKFYLDLQKLYSIPGYLDYVFNRLRNLVENSK